VYQRAIIVIGDRPPYRASPLVGVRLLVTAATRARRGTAGDHGALIDSRYGN
jgi:hypothetical protein